MIKEFDTEAECVAHVQEALLAAVEGCGFNNMDGAKVVEDLRQHRDLWRAMQPHSDLVVLRNMSIGETPNYSAVYFTVRRENLEAFLAVVEGWEADEVGWITSTGSVCGCGEFERWGTISREYWWELGGGIGPDLVLVRVWWD